MDSSYVLFYAEVTLCQAGMSHCVDRRMVDEALLSFGRMRATLEGSWIRYRLSFEQLRLVRPQPLSPATLFMSDLIEQASELYDAYGMESLPAALRRNSLDYYYLSIYPSLAEMRPFSVTDLPPYPNAIHNAYIHIPFCSGVCEFCSYYLIAISPGGRDRIGHYLESVKREFAYHAERTELDITYLYFGGGTPSLIPTEALDGFLSYLAHQGWLGSNLLGTLELHPEFFNNTQRAHRFLDILKHYGLSRVSIGYQVSDDHILSATKRRHHADFIEAAMAMVRKKGFYVNLDLMYGLDDQSLASWEATLRDAVELSADSLSTYFLFVDPGTVTYKKVRDGRIVLPSHRHLQTQHIMAQQYLGQQGYWELPNDFYARDVTDGRSFRPEQLQSQRVTLPIGPGAYGHYSNTQLANVFNLDDYEHRLQAGNSPLWRGYRLSGEQAFHRDVMFSFKNDPYLDCSLFLSHYNCSPLDVFQDIFDHLLSFELIEIDEQAVRLTPKGRLCVEEISSLFRHADIRPNGSEVTADRAIIEQHNFAPTYPAVAW